MSYPNLHPTVLLGQIRSDKALAAALELGMSDEQAWTVADRARKEALAGVREGTQQFAGTVSIGVKPDGSKALRIRSYTGNFVDPLRGGIENASTQD